MPEGATTPGRWVDAGDIRDGDELLLRDGRILPVQSVRCQPYKDKVYNFHVQDIECYAVGQTGVLVHNTNGESVQKAVQSLQERIAEHKQKLADYINNPDAFDNKGFLRNAPTQEIRQNIIDGRIRHLETELKAFEDGVKKLLGGD